jgi:hypothetical protein
VTRVLPRVPKTSSDMNLVATLTEAWKILLEDTLLGQKVWEVPLPALNNRGPSSPQLHGKQGRANHAADRRALAGQSRAEQDVVDLAVSNHNLLVRKTL